MWGLISGVLSVVGGWLGFQTAIQKRDNAGDMIANANAKRDEHEREQIQSTVQKSDQQGSVSDDERKAYAED